MAARGLASGGWLLRFWYSAKTTPTPTRPRPPDVASPRGARPRARRGGRPGRGGGGGRGAWGGAVRHASGAVTGVRGGLRVAARMYDSPVPGAGTRRGRCDNRDPMAAATSALPTPIAFPPVPKTAEETGLPFTFVCDLILKVLYFNGGMLGRDLARHTCVPFTLIESVMKFLSDEGYCSSTGMRTATLDPSSRSPPACSTSSPP